MLDRANVRFPPNADVSPLKHDGPSDGRSDDYTRSNISELLDRVAKDGINPRTLSNVTIAYDPPLI